MNRINIQHLPPEVYKAEIQAFAEKMLEQLQGNEHKGNWVQWKPENGELRIEITEQLHRYCAFREGNPEAARIAAIDIACLAMKAFAAVGR